MESQKSCFSIFPGLKGLNKYLLIENQIQEDETMWTVFKLI